MNPYNPFPFLPEPTPPRLAPPGAIDSEYLYRNIPIEFIVSDSEETEDESANDSEENKSERAQKKKDKEDKKKNKPLPFDHHPTVKKSELIFHEMSDWNTPPAQNEQPSPPKFDKYGFVIPNPPVVRGRVEYKDKNRQAMAEREKDRLWGPFWGPNVPVVGTADTADAADSNGVDTNATTKAAAKNTAATGAGSSGAASSGISANNIAANSTPASGTSTSGIAANDAAGIPGPAANGGGDDDAWGAATDKGDKFDTNDDSWGENNDAATEVGDAVNERSHPSAFKAKSSAKAEENIAAAKQSSWTLTKSDANGSEGIADDGAEEGGVDKSKSQQWALLGMRRGNGSGYEAPAPEFGSMAAKYEWRDEYGDVAPEFPELEKMLFQDAFTNRIGDFFDDMSVGKVSVLLESEEQIQPFFEWEDAGLHPIMVENIKKCGYHKPTAVQGYCIPSVLTGHDVIAISHTGSGKTAAYLIPTISKLMGKMKKLGAGRPSNIDDFDPLMDGIRGEPLILIIVPTRELAIQVFDESRRFCYRSQIRPVGVYGGGPTRKQMDDIRKGCDLLIATPGRLIDFLKRPGLLSLHRVRFTIIDEADELVSLDWADEMETILSGTTGNCDGDHRYMMFSATFPRQARALAKRHLADDHIRLRLGRAGAAHKHVQQSVFWVDPETKNQALMDLILTITPARTMIFVNTKRTCDEVDDFLYHCGMPVTSIHSDRTQEERESALRAFRTGDCPLLVATGVSARGLDVFNVMHVICYDLPSAVHGGISEYVHRIGRTARIGNMGSSTAFYNERNEEIAQDLVNLLVESKNIVPDFLEHLKPQDGAEPDFEDDKSESGDEEAFGGNPGNDGWGQADATNNSKGDSGNDGW